METIPETTHIPEDTLERLARGKLPASQVAVISEHLFECDECSGRYTHTVNFLRGLREAAAVPEPKALRPWWTVPLLPRPALAAGLAFAGLLVVSARFIRAPEQSPATVELQAYRDSAMPVAPAGQELRIRLRATGGDQLSATAELVNGAGVRLWKGAVRLHEGNWDLAPGVKVSEGQYWIRLFDSESGQQIQEYGLLVK